MRRSSRGLRHGRTGRLRAAAGLLSVLLAAACGEAGERPPGGPRLDCDALAWDRSGAEPGTRVPVRGVPPESAAGVVFEFRAPRADAAEDGPAAEPSGGGAGDARPGAGGGPVPLLVFTDPGLAFLSPPHPSGRLEGGRVEIRARFGERACPFRVFEVRSLPSAPGALADVADRLRDLLRVEAGLFGLTPADLAAADPADLPAPVVPLALARAVLDRQDDPRSLRRSPEAGGGGGGAVALVEALLARDGVSGGLRSLGAGLDSLASDEGGGGEVTVVPSAPGRSGSPDARRRRPIRAAGPARLASLPAGGSAPRALRPPPLADPTASPWRLCGLSGPGAFVEPSAQQLDCMMRAAKSTEIASTGRAKEIFEAFQLALLVGQQLSKAAGGAGKSLEKAYAFVGEAAAVYILLAEALSKVLPSELTEFDVGVTQLSFDEDDPGPGRWLRARVKATSEGWQVEGLFFGYVMKKYLRTTAGDDAGAALEESLKGARDQVKSRARDGAVPDIPPMEFGPTDVVGWEGTEASVRGGAVQWVGPRTYAPRLVGSSKLVFRTRLGYQTIERRRDMRVWPIRLSITPVEVSVQPGARVDYRVEVENAKDRSVDWTVIPAHPLEAVGEEGLAATLATRKEEDLFPVKIRVESTADRSHLLERPSRVVEAYVNPYRIGVEPAAGCLQPGEERRFRAEVPDVDLGGVVFEADGDGSDVRWSASRGEIGDDGIFRAPDEAGEVTITAGSRGVPDLKGEAVVRVGGCVCWMLADVGRPANRRFQGVAKFSPAGGTMPPGVRVSGDVLTITNRLGFGRSPTVANTFYAIFEAPGLADGSTGTFPVEHAWAEQGAGFTAMIDPSAPTSGYGTVYVDESADGVVEGRVEAWLSVFSLRNRVLDSEDAFLTPVVANFRAVTGGSGDRDSDYFRCRMQASDRDRPGGKR